MADLAKFLMDLPVYVYRPTGERYCTISEELRDDVIGDLYSALSVVSLGTDYRDQAQAAVRALLPHVIAIDDDAGCYSVPRKLFDKLIEAVGEGAADE